jgi:prolipoprotein diacylglyceryltransferase
MFLNMGQWLSVPFIVAGVVLLWWSSKYGKPALVEAQPAASRSHKRLK